MLRDNLAGLIEPMIDRAGAHPPSGHPKQGPPGGCYSSTEVAIVALKRSWRQIFPWKTRRQAENGKRPGLEGTTAAHDSRTVRTAQHQSHRTIDPTCLKKSPPRRGGIYALTENVASPFHAEPRQARSSECVVNLALENPSHRNVVYFSGHCSTFRCPRFGSLRVIRSQPREGRMPDNAGLMMISLVR